MSFMSTFLRPLAWVSGPSFLFWLRMIYCIPVYIQQTMVAGIAEIRIVMEKDGQDEGLTFAVGGM